MLQYLAAGDSRDWVTIAWIPTAIVVGGALMGYALTRLLNRETANAANLAKTLEEHSKALNVLALGVEKLVGKVEPLQDTVADHNTTISRLRESVSSLSATIEIMDKYQKEKYDDLSHRIASQRKGDG